MRVLTLARNYLQDKTVGVLFGDDIRFPTLERPWLNNKVSISCIPEGSYYVKRDKTGKHQYYAVQDVDGRTNIELHSGNKAAHSEGCILVGMDFDERYNLTSSGRAMDKLLFIIGDNDFILNIRAATKDDF